MASDLEGRLARLEDREAIRELAVRSCDGVDGAQAQALGELFTVDSVVDFGRFGVFRGRDVIVPFLSRLAGRLRSFAHVLHNHVIDALTPSAATARCDFQVTGLSRQGKQVQVAGYYTDALVKTEGRWRFTSRQATFVAFFTLPVEVVHLGAQPAGPGAQLPE
jgi:SnoaL-like domain